MQDRSSYTRQSAQEDAKKFLKYFQEDLTKWLDVLNIRDAFEMLERELGGFFSHPQTLYSTVVNLARQLCFPSGYVLRGDFGIGPGRDFLIVFNELASNPEALLEKINYSHKFNQKKIDSFKNLKNPEQGILLILGYDLTVALFMMRQDLLQHLCFYEKYNQKIMIISAVLKTLSKENLVYLSHLPFKEIRPLQMDLEVFNMEDKEQNPLRVLIKKFRPHRDCQAPFEELSKSSLECKTSLPPEDMKRFHQEADFSLGGQLFEYLDRIESLLKKHFNVEFCFQEEALTRLPSWEENLTANTLALNKLKKGKDLKPSEVTLARWGMLSNFQGPNPYYSSAPSAPARRKSSPF